MLEKTKKILVVDDEAKIVDAVTAYLEKEKFRVFTAVDGERALALFEELDPDLIVLDLMLPKISGEDLCRRIRLVSNVPIIMLTAKSGEDDKVSGFDVGADDYLTKPFSPRELVARVHNLFRRCREEAPALRGTLRRDQGRLEVDLDARLARKDGTPLPLTPSEFGILALLAGTPLKTFTREELIDAVFGKDFDGFERTVDTHVKNLRNKIEDGAEPRYILTVRGSGYRFGAASAGDRQ